MSFKDKNDMIFKDYLDVSSEDEPIKNNKKVDDNIINKNKLNNNEFYSHRNKDIFIEDKNYSKNKRKNSSQSHSRNRKRYDKNRSRSRSRSHHSHHHRNKKYHYYKGNESDYSNNRHNDRSSSNSYRYNEKDRYRYRRRDRNTKYKNDNDYIYEKRYYNSHSHSYSKSNSSIHKKNEKNNENMNKNEFIKGNKWTDGEKKEEFKQIKIEKYDKNKSLKEIQKRKEKDEEISKLKKDLNKKVEQEENKLEVEKEKPNFEPSGILLKELEMEYNKSINSKTMINYNPPTDSIVPSKNEIWFLFKFSENKKEEEETYKLIDKDFFLIGKDPRICDIRIKQKNISRQHAVIQFRKIRKEKEWKILPYLIDLNSTNGTYLNGDKIDNKKYYELREKDQLNFGDKNLDFLLMKAK